MSRRNYAELSSYDFECLVRDLLSAEWGERLEVFPPGTDGGIDVRLLKTSAGQQTSVQCKHSPGKSWADISGALRREARKVAGRNLGEYWLVTSAGLTPQAKDRVADLFKSQSLVPERILSYPDIDSLLNDHPDVERSNYKLYLTSAAILDLLIRPDLFLYAQDLLAGIDERRKYYVQGAGLADAQSILEDEHCCIISGPPGVGKSTLAEMVTLNLIEEGYTPFWISEDIREADQLWRPDTRQVFLYDDFLGQNALVDKLGKNEDSRLLATMQRVKRSPKHRLIMTTREYILTAAQQTYERLQDSRISLSKLIVDVSAYSRFQKAHILYNHIYFSSLDETARKAIAKRNEYESVISHENYNPRLIKLVIDAAIAEGGEVAAEKFPDFIRSSLSNPAKLWEHIFTRQLTPAARDILLTLTTFQQREVEIDDLRQAVSSLSKTMRGTFSTEEHQNGMALCDGVFVVVQQDLDRRMVRFHNPGLRDYLLGYLQRNPSLFGHLAQAAIWPEQAFSLRQMIVQPHAHLRLASDYREELQKAHLETPSVMVDTCLSMVGKPSANWSRRFEGIHHKRMIRSSRDNERLAESALHLAQPVGQREVDKVINVINNDLVPLWRSNQGNKTSTLKLLFELTYVVDSTTCEWYIDVIATWFNDSLNEADDFALWFELFENHGPFARFNIEDFTEEFRSFAVSRLSELLIEDDINVLSYDYDQIDTLARAVELEEYLREDLEAVSQHLAIMDHDDTEYQSRGGGLSAGDDGSIDTLFGTLRDS